MFTLDILVWHHAAEQAAEPDCTSNSVYFGIYLFHVHMYFMQTSFGFWVYASNYWISLLIQFTLSIFDKIYLVELMV